MATSNIHIGFSSNYMVLNPEDVNLVDLFKILFVRDIEKRKFVNTPEEREESFGRRWIIFISIIVQKILQFGKKPLASFGSFVEVWLHLLTVHGNVAALLLNFFRGKVVKPDTSSSTFLSFTGNMDKRVEFDESIKNGDPKYYAQLSIMAAKASYENKAYIETTVKDHWKMDLIGSYDFWNEYQEKYTTQAFILHDKTSNVVVVAFRGTETFDADAWCTDFDLSWYEIQGIGKLHGGFMKALGLQKTLGWPKEINQDKIDRPAVAYYTIREKLRELMHANDKKNFLVTGHSLGAALAILFPAILALHDEAWMLERLEGIYTFGQPRVGNDKFGEFMVKQLKKYSVQYYRFVYNNDLVPRLPYDDSTLMFKHFGTCLFYNSFYEASVLHEEPNKNYFSPLWVIPKMLTAIWELIRSFVIPFTKGPNYKEGGLMRFFRVVGLAIPGVPNHLPQDYVNAIRLGSSGVFLPKNVSKRSYKKIN